MKITKNSEKLQSKNKAGFILKPKALHIIKEYEIIKDYFIQAGIEIILEEKSALKINEVGIPLEKLCKKVDFLVSIGGDGTLISVVRRSFAFNKPVLGINLGTLGFLTDIAFDEVKSFLNSFNNDEYRIDSRMMIKGITAKKNFVAFNDVVISKKSISSMIEIEAKVDSKPFNTYYGDGLIISTPTGSTAYNLSVGGPVVYPLTEAFIVTPIAPHSLTQRPLVLPADFQIEFTITDKQGATVIVDGQDILELEQDDILKIEIANDKAKLIHRVERNYFEVLSEKLQWGN